ncbi:MAG: hypothetical protein JNN21_12350 [Candidatus Accumulibacter sp.]|nr:hypothetical protein [Accumulibacter sp.]
MSAPSPRCSPSTGGLALAGVRQLPGAVEAVDLCRDFEERRPDCVILIGIATRRAAVLSLALRQLCS